MGDQERPRTEKPLSCAVFRAWSMTSSWTLGSLTTPFLPTFSLPASNWGLIRQTISPPGGRMAAAGGRILDREMKETSTLAKSGMAAGSRSSGTT